MFSFPFGQIPVRVHLPFAILCVLLAAGQGSASAFLPVVVVLFLSVMIHELGHAYMGRAFGYEAEIHLHGLGGTTMFSGADGPLAPWKGLLVTLAGPSMGLATWIGLTLLLRARGSTMSVEAEHTLQMGRDINLFWSLFNLLPVLPLDGGSAFRQVVSFFSKERAFPIARIVSYLVAGGVAVLAFRAQLFFMAVYCAILAVQNFRTRSVPTS